MFKNIIANYIGRFWGLLSVSIFIPQYIKLLGIESFAVINFYTVISTVLYFADGGLSATLNREVAKTNDKNYISNLLFTIERFYFFICSIIILGISLSSGLISTHWLNSDAIPKNELVKFIILMSFNVSLQLFISLENSGLMGLEKQVLANTIQVIGNILKSGLVLVPLYFFPSLQIFFLWQILINLIVLIVTRFYLWSFIKANSRRQFDFKILKAVGGFAIGMMVMALISSVNSQIDKIIVSKILSLKNFGYYSLAGVLAQLPVIVVSPIAVTILPRLIKYSTIEDKTSLIRLFHQNSFIISVVSSTIALVLFLFTEDFVFIWTKNFQISVAINNVSKILLIGSVFLSFQYMPYHLAIANGHTKTNLKIGIAVALLIIPATVYSVKKFGLIGAGIPWLVMNLIAYLYLGYFLLNKFLNSEICRWFYSGTLIPLLLTAIVGITAFSITSHLKKGIFIIGYSIVIGIINILINYIAYNLMNSRYKISISKVNFK